MGLKKNFTYNSILTLSQYVIAFITFPYVTRVLGVTNYGIVSFIDGIINYYAIFVLLGISILGTREVAKAKNSPEELSKVYSSLLTLSIILAIIVIAIYCICITLIPALSKHSTLFYIGISKLLATAFLIEWFYSGLDQFQYIAIKIIIIKVIYVISIFIFIKDTNDYSLYFILTISVVILNALVNTTHARIYVKYTIRYISDIPQYIKPTFALGGYMILTSMYTTFNIMFLGIVSTPEEVGYYSTALKIYTIILGLYTAFTTVLMPRASNLLVNGQTEKIEKLVRDSYGILTIFTIPIASVCIIFAPQLINILSGATYMPASLPMQIIMPLLLIVGIAQIISRIVIIPLGYDNIILKASIIGALIGVSANILLVPRYGSIGTAITLALSETTVTCYYIYKSSKLVYALPWRNIAKLIMAALPYPIICAICSLYIDNKLTALIVASGLCITYFIIINLVIMQNPLLTGLCKISKKNQ